MGTIAFFVLLLGLLCIIIPVVYLKGEDSRRKEQNVLLEIAANHIGGHPYLNAGDTVYLQIRNDNTLHFYNKNIDNQIEIKDILKYEIKTDEQISKDVTFGRFLMFGLVSFALKKQTTTIQEYLTLSYKQNDLEIDCLFKGGTSLGNLAGALNRFRIENNRVEQE